jgi:hypothetical protein
MSQKQLPIPPDDGGQQQSDPLTVDMPTVPRSDILDKLDKVLEASLPKASKRKPSAPKCCGILPCKGRSPWCYTCDICLDCITSVGCGHDDSRHTYKHINEVA